VCPSAGAGIREETQRRRANSPRPVKLKGLLQTEGPMRCMDFLVPQLSVIAAFVNPHAGTSVMVSVPLR
jgi:hypothetical protein